MHRSGMLCVITSRNYDYLLGGKATNISQVVPAVPYNGSTAIVQARHVYYSKITSSAVRDLSGPCLGVNVRFVGLRFLTLT